MMVDSYILIFRERSQYTLTKKMNEFVEKLKERFIVDLMHYYLNFSDFGS